MLSIRKAGLDAIQQGDKFFRWRGGEVSRLESLFDAIIALALTLIVVSVEVPSSFDELLTAFRKLPSFAVCFAILLMCWYYHFSFHRRYGLEDFPLLLLNSVLMFLVVFYVYPLKFLYSFMFARGETQISNDQIPMLMTMYSGGFAAIFSLLTAMHLYAYWKRRGLELTSNEELLTRARICELSLYVLFGFCSIAFAFVPGWVPLSGLVYFLLGPAQGLNGYLWGRRIEEEADIRLIHHALVDRAL